MDGLALARAIKADSSIANTRLIMLTSLGHQFCKAELDEIGLDACLVKPIKLSWPFDCLANAADRGRPRNSATTVSGPANVRTRKLRILLAEDNAVNQKVALGQLRKLGHTADAVANGLEVLDAIQRIPYDLLLIDCGMPEMDGFEAHGTHPAREQRDSLPRLHIIALTAHAMAGDRQKCLDAGMDDYLSKPVRLEELQKALERFCAKQPGGQTLANPQAPPVPATAPIEAGGHGTIERSGHGDQQQMRELVDLYFAQADEILSGLDTAIKADAPKEVERLAHKLAGASVAWGYRCRHAAAGTRTPGQGRPIVGPRTPPGIGQPTIGRHAAHSRGKTAELQDDLIGKQSE